MTRPHPENMVQGQIYLLIIDAASQFPGHVEGHGEGLVGAVVMFRGLELYQGRLFIAANFPNDPPELEHWVSWHHVRHVLEPREDDLDQWDP